MEERVELIRKNALEELKAVSEERSLQLLKSKYLGRKGEVSALIKEIMLLPAEKRPYFGKLINELKDYLEGEFERVRKKIREEEKRRRIIEERIDITLPGRRIIPGKKHPLTQITEEMIEIFVRMGFSVEEGPEIETDYYNFEALNIPKDHPARDMQDTFYITDDIILRTHTSPVQIRAMLKKGPPIRIIAPGTVYRCDSDISHTPMFHQLEGLMVDEGISFSHLKGILTQFVKIFFGKKTALRFRPSFFPFTEPSAEVDIECVLCMGKGCRLCKNSGWLEILGAGMVHPRVLKEVHYDTERYTGFAFGMGIERICMLKYGINDIRLFFENDLRFLKQF